METYKYPNLTHIIDENNRNKNDDDLYEIFTEKVKNI